MSPQVFAQNNYLFSFLILESKLATLKFPQFQNDTETDRNYLYKKFVLVHNVIPCNPFFFQSTLKMSLLPTRAVLMGLGQRI